MTSSLPASPHDSSYRYARAMREAHLKFERYRRGRDRLLVATAIAGILPLVAAFRPDVVPPDIGALAFPAWVCLGLLTAGVALAEWLWYRSMVKRADALRRLPPR